MKRLYINTYLYMLVIFLVVYFVVVPIVNRNIFESILHGSFIHSIGHYHGQIFRGFFHSIETDLKRLPVDEWDSFINDVQPHCVFPIRIASMAAEQLTADERLALNRGEIVVQGVSDMRHQIGQSGLLLCMGPVPEVGDVVDHSSFQRYTQIIICSVIVVLFTFFALMWAFPLAINLKRLSSAATTLGQGNLDTRARVSRHSSLASLAGAFNGMADRLQQLIAAHRELTHTVSHELRTPLARIRFDMEMMASQRDPAVREQHHESIRRNVDELEMLISELLTYARFDHENFRLQKEVVELGSWLTALISKKNDETGSIRIDCRIDGTDFNLPAQVNPRFLGRAVHNLIQNAVRYTCHRIHVTLAADDRFCMIHVDDDGPGIAIADHQRIFEPFVRLDDDIAHENDGYGLGLAIVRRVAEWHGGQAMVSASSLGGARFSLRLPLL